MNKIKQASTTHFSQIPWMRYKFLYFGLSLVVILIGIFSILKWNFVLGIDFAGGTNFEYKFSKEQTPEGIQKTLKEKNIEVTSVTKSQNNIFDLKLGQVDESQKDTLNKTLSSLGGEGSTLLSFEQVGPSLSQELIQKTLYAILLSAGAILLWIAYQFKSVKFGVSATIATFHDAFVVVGLFSLLGHYFGAQVDYLFVTALLTILSFSVHDTIVVYDRIREIRRKHGGSVAEVANRALSETMRRSFFNSFTIIIMLICLAILGGNTIRWFAVALAIGTISGTYSSPFVSVPVLVTWEEIQKKLKKK
jgi:preprotein translocase subunit SecF